MRPRGAGRRSHSDSENVVGLARVVTARPLVGWTGRSPCPSPFRSPGLLDHQARSAPDLCGHHPTVGGGTRPPLPLAGTRADRKVHTAVPPPPPPRASTLARECASGLPAAIAAVPPAWADPAVPTAPHLQCHPPICGLGCHPQRHEWCQIGLPPRWVPKHANLFFCLGTA